MTATYRLRYACCGETAVVTFFRVIPLKQNRLDFSG